MLKIRLARIGRKNDPTFRVVVTNSQNGPKAGKHTELLGTHNPKLHETKLDGDRIKYWISKGAQVSDTMHNLLINHKIIDGKKINVLPKKSPIVSEKESEEETAPGAPVEATPEAPATPEEKSAGQEESAPAAPEAEATPALAEETPTTPESAEEAPTETPEEEKQA